MMTHKQALALIKNLSQQFHVATPVVLWDRTSKNSMMTPPDRSLLYYTRRGKRTRMDYVYIGLGSQCAEYEMKKMVVHEFAHVIDYYRGFRGKDVWQWSCHGPSYFDALTDVATVAYGDPIKYPWRLERVEKHGPYHRLYTWARRAGFTT